MRLIDPKLLCAILCFAALLCGVPSCSQAAGEENYDHGLAPLNYGWVLYSQLSDLAPRSADAAFHLLMERRFTEAFTQLSAQHALYPDSFAITEGMLQASVAQESPDMVLGEISKLNGEPVDSLNDDEKFQLAVALYYYSSREYPMRPIKMMQKSQRLLAALWTESPDPVVGLTLAETLSYAGPDADAVTAKYTTGEILDQLICSIGGPRVANLYTDAERSHWMSDPPGIAGVPDSNLFELLAIVTSQRSIFHDQSGRVHDVKGFEINEWNTFSPEQIDGQHYFDTWSLEILKDLGLQPLHSAGT